MNDPLSTGREARQLAVARLIFEHARNLVLCATLLALGLAARRRSGDLLGGAFCQAAVGWGVVAAAAALALLNFWTGVTQLKQWQHWKLWSGLLLAAYLAVTARVMEVMTVLKLDGR